MTPPVKECRSCGAEIYWVVFPKTDKTMPVDAEPVGDGNILLSVRGTALVGHVMGSKDPEPDPDRNRYVSHFTTCPHATRHRKRR